eukprot:gene8955-12076_t
MSTDGFSASLFITAPSDNLLCPICYQVMNDPVQCLSGHSFCRGCFNYALERKATCPTCRVELNKTQLVSNLFARNLIGDLVMHCIHYTGDVSTDKANEEILSGKIKSLESDSLSKIDYSAAVAVAVDYKSDIELSINMCNTNNTDKGSCCWIGSVDKLHDHLSTECLHHSIPCINLPHCSVMISRKDLDQHLTHDCLYRNITCEYCFETIKFGHKATHHTTCMQEMVPCPLFTMGCIDTCNGFLPRNELESHTDNLTNHSILLKKLIRENLSLQDRLKKSDIGLIEIQKKFEGSQKLITTQQIQLEKTNKMLSEQQIHIDEQIRTTKLLQTQIDEQDRKISRVQQMQIDEHIKIVGAQQTTYNDQLKILSFHETRLKKAEDNLDTMRIMSAINNPELYELNELLPEEILQIKKFISYAFNNNDNYSIPILSIQFLSKNTRLSINVVQWKSYHIIEEFSLPSIVDMNTELFCCSPIKKINDHISFFIALQKIPGKLEIGFYLHLKGYLGDSNVCLTLFRFGSGDPNQRDYDYVWDGTNNSIGWYDFMTTKSLRTDGYINPITNTVCALGTLQLNLKY